MQVSPLKLNHAIQVGDGVFDITIQAVANNGIRVCSGDVFVVTSKIVSYEQSRMVRLSDVTPSDVASAYAKQYGISAELMELILQEADVIYGGVDVALWPKNLRSWINQFRLKLTQHYSQEAGALVTDSSCMPMRIGTVGVALAASGFKPAIDYRDLSDLYDRTIIITQPGKYALEKTRSL